MQRLHLTDVPGTFRISPPCQRDFLFSSCGPATVRSPILLSITVTESAGELLTSRTLFSLRLKQDASIDHFHPSILCGKQEDGIEEATITCIALASQRHKATKANDSP